MKIWLARAGLVLGTALICERYDLTGISETLGIWNEKLVYSTLAGFLAL